MARLDNKWWQLAAEDVEESFKMLHVLHDKGHLAFVHKYERYVDGYPGDGMGALSKHGAGPKALQFDADHGHMEDEVANYCAALSEIRKNVGVLRRVFTWMLIPAPEAPQNRDKVA